jgi:hypothetical protein
MPSGHFRYELAVVAIVCIVSIFLFPIPVGPYCAVHGPATELRALHAAMKLRWVMALAALTLSTLALEIKFRILGESFTPVLHLSPAPGSAPILRC